jgi:hypothetical protein
MDKKYFQEILSYSFKTKNKVIPEHLVKPFLREEGINVPRYVLVEKLSDLEKVSRLHFPVALKVSSSKFIHKTDVGGVILNIKNKAELRRSVVAFKRKFKGEKLLIEEMVKGNVEMISGLIYDSNFGMCIMIGVGGIYTEIYKDTSTRVVPVSKEDVLQMISELKGKDLLEGFRGIKANKDAFVDLVLKLSDIGRRYKSYILGLDANPIILDKNKATVVDAKMILK